jgi:4-amino-4-deoxy-L-arabinose transferase-like glycosyltransferase
LPLLQNAKTLLRQKYIPLILILLLAFVLRTYRLTEVPPGLTHDEANHGRDSINVLNGELLFYFPLNYGSEPLYNYVVAGNMALVGENLFALRYVNVLAGLLGVAGGFLWARLAFGREVGLIGSALLAVSFWPLVTSRQALRAGLLPFLGLVAVLLFWRLVAIPKQSEERSAPGGRARQRPGHWLTVLLFSLATAATLHTYLASRVLWLVFPLFLVYLAIWHQPWFRRSWPQVVTGLLAAGLFVIPMFRYVQTHPEAETRLEMLDGPVQNLTSGNFYPVLKNGLEAAAALVWPGFGDHFLAYNIPGRPVLNGITAAFFLLGIAVALKRWRRPPYALLLIWFLMGISPSLITGPEANTTRNLGALIAVYLFPALGFTSLARWNATRWGDGARRLAQTSLVVWLIFVLIMTARDYFVRWAGEPDVRAAYQHTLVEALAFVEDSSRLRPTVISSVYPGPAHDPSIARVLAPSLASNARWVDARYALILPGGRAAELVLPSSTPLHPAFAGLVNPLERITLRPDDLDPAFSLLDLEPPRWELTMPPVNFGNAMTLMSARWLVQPVTKGETAGLLTVWRIDNPVAVGPVVPPAYETDVVLFTHVLDGTGSILVQRDSLEAPSWDWQNGDLLLQIHPLFIPPDSRPGSYDTIVGVYDRLSGERLTVIGEEGAIVEDRAFVVPLQIDGR